MRPSRTVGEWIEVSLPDGSVTLISPEDRSLLEEFPWWRRSGRHVRAAKPISDEHGNRVKASRGYYAMDDDYLHRRIMCPGEGQVVDHINGNGLDNRRENLRACTRAENALNRLKARGQVSQFKGVFFRPKANRQRPWQAFISVDGKQHHIGYFSTELDAAVAYNACAGLVSRGFRPMNPVD